MTGRSTVSTTARADRWRGRFAFVVIPVIGVALLSQVRDIAPSERAHDHVGIRGIFTAEHRSCGRSSCHWSGTFTAPGDVKASTGYAQADPPFEVGTPVLALDSGSSDHVYPLDGGDDWLVEPILATVGAIVLVTWLGFSVWLLRRRRRRRRAESDTFVLT